jgi:Fur family transcriptional regulator, peroxide stress response regulator
MGIHQGELDKRVEHFRSGCLKAGLKLTQQRLEIFKALAARDDHPDAEALFSALRSHMPTLSLDTVYRTLWLLNDLGLINTLGPRRESIRFDANLRQHHHFVCLRCGLTQDFESDRLNELPIPDEARSMGKVLASQVELRGICAACSHAEAL